MARLLMIISLLMVVPTIVLAAGTEPPPSKETKPLVLSTPEWKPVEDEPLPTGAMVRIGHMRAWHGIEGTIVAMPDGKRLVASFVDRSIRVWEAESGKLIRAFKPANNRLIQVAVSPDGNTIAAGEGHSVNLYDLGDRSDMPRTLQHHQGQVMTLAFSSDGKRLVSGGYEANICVWDVKSGKLAHTIKTSGQTYIASTVFVNDDTCVATNTSEGAIKIWRIDNGQLVQQLNGMKDAVRLHPLPNGKRLAATSYRDGTFFWDVDKPDPIKQLKELTGYGVFSADGRYLATSGIDYPAASPTRVYDLETDKEVGRIEGGAAGTYPHTFSRDQKTLITYGNDRTFRRWDLKTFKEIGSVSGHQNRVTGLTFTPDGKRLISAAQDGTIRTWDPATGRELQRLTATSEFFNAMALSPDGKSIAVTSIPMQTRWRWDFQEEKSFCYLRFLDLATTKEQSCFYLPGETGGGVQFTPDSREVLLTNYLHVRFHEVKTGKDRRPFPDAKQGLRAAVISPDGKQVVVSTDEPAIRQVGKIAYYDATNGKEEFSRSFVFGGFNSLAYSPDGKFLAVAGGVQREGQSGLVLWEPPTDKIIREFEGNHYDTYKVAYSPDGRLLAAADPLGISVFETASAQERWHFKGGHLDNIHSIVFSPDSRIMATGGDDTLINLWDLTGLHKQKPVPFDARDLDAAWSTLADIDAHNAGRAISRLAARPQESVPYLKLRLGVLTDADRQKINAFVADLDSDNFKVRDRATKELENYGEAAIPALTRAAAKAKSEEVRTKAEQIIKKIGPGEDPVVNATARRAVRAIEALEHAGTPEALALLKEIERSGKSQLEHAEAQKAVKRLEKK